MHSSTSTGHGRTRTSPLWQLFKRISPGLAKCCVCRKQLSFKSSITNLKRHLLLKHGGAFEEILNQCIPNTELPSQVTAINLITLVKKHPCLWDTHCDTYGSVEVQLEAWKSIAARLYPTDRREGVETQLAEQFDALRNEYFSNRRCSYHQEMSFMSASIDEYEPQTQPVEEDFCNVQIKEEVLDESSLNKAPTNKDQHFTVEEYDYNDRLQIPTIEEDHLTSSEYKPEVHHHVNSTAAAALTQCSLQMNKVDENTLFLLSLAGDMRKVPHHLVTDFKVELMSVFSEMVKKYETKN